MAHTRKFNRHENMKGVTMTAIMFLLNKMSIRENDNLTNMLYGLFDGYDYTEAIREIAEGMDKHSDEYRFLDAICDEVEEYPDGETQLF
jgi:hypothetical protein